MITVSLSLSESLIEKIDSLKTEKEMSRSRCANLILKKGFECLEHENKGAAEQLQ